MMRYRISRVELDPNVVENDTWSDIVMATGLTCIGIISDRLNGSSVNKSLKFFVVMLSFSTAYKAATLPAAAAAAAL